MTQRIVDRTEPAGQGGKGAAQPTEGAGAGSPERTAGAEDGQAAGTGSAPLVVREAAAADAAFIGRLAAEADMGELSDRGRTYVAERGGAPVGFIRLLEDKGMWYVNPVVVDATHRREGIGEVLMRYACDRFGELRFVARGYAVPFYEALGCENVPWEAIAPVVADDCDGCDLLPDCHPQPMRMR